MVRAGEASLKSDGTMIQTAHIETKGAKRGHPVPVVRMSTFYFVYFAGVGALLPYLSPYLESLKFSPAAIGEIMGFLLAARIAMPPLIAWLADGKGWVMGIIRTSCFAAAVSFMGMFFGTSYWWIAATVALFSFSRDATLPLFETVTLNHLGEKAQRYTRVRLWGSIGFIVAVSSVGPAMDAFGPKALLYIAQGIFILLALNTWIIPSAPQGELRAREGTGLRKALLRRESIVVILVSMLVQASHGPYYAFYSIYLEGHSFSGLQIGGMWSLGVAAEVLLFLRADRILGRFDWKNLLMVTLALTALRWLLIGAFPHLLAVLLAAQLLHAVSFGLFHALLMMFVHGMFQGRSQARGQAIYASVGYGIGGAAGSAAAGHLWSAMGHQNTFMAAAALPLVGLLLAAWLLPARIAPR